MKLLTERLVIREPEAKDCGDIADNINDYEVVKNLLLVPYPYSLKNAKDWVSKCQKTAKEKPRKKYSLIIELKSEKKVIGGIGIESVDLFQGTAEIGYWLSRKYWRNGLMSEALEKVLPFCFDKLKLRRINLNAFTENLASNNIAKKFGFIYEGVGRQKVRSKADGNIHDENYYGLLKEEWEMRRR